MTQWSTRPLGDLCRLVNGRAFKPSDWTTTGLPIVRIQNLNDRDKPFNRYDGPVDPRVLIDSGAILLSWSGTPGTSFGCFSWDRGRAILNHHIFRVHVDEASIDPEFFIHAVNSKLEEMIALAHGGVGLRHITKGKLEGIHLPVPPLKEQRRIVGCVSECIARLEEMRVLREIAAQESKALLPSSLAAVFDDLKGTCPWAAVETVLTDTRYGTSQKCDAADDAIPVLRIPNVSDGQVNFANLKYCNLDSSELKRLALEVGDLLVVRTNGSPDLVGRCAVFEGASGPCAFASYLIRMRVDRKKADPRFMAFFLASTHGRDAISAIRRTSAGQFNVNSENLRAIQVPLPPVAAQERIAERLQEQQVVARSIAAEQAVRLSESAKLRAAVLRKAFAGQL
ncbi:MAG TPA: restriction endonuclease subunit S [Thermoanaerobaculia bacterium]|nr:restriction endonuclease subunit S [Thermoanaerobaculia bacterium]